ncbi:hypothetical protein [Aquimarina algiphila]|uniref:Lipocalin-like domain-containing protein n=1 Tax=Aquimarina algiphila TaxID=2047982 RepID=A0A554VIS3_9FLAO|nr:hypothetical protein [Aquimarina algiphila]TSE07672.1 hypothetical protein FOF46_15330 [Aquimarina algiphila]
MKKTILFLIYLLSITIHAQESELLGRWQLTKIDDIDAEQEHIFPPLLEFLPNNKIIIKFRNPVFWKYENDTIYIKNKEHEKYRNKMTVLGLHKNTLIVKNYREEKLVFRRLEKTEKKDIYGIWTVKAMKKGTKFNTAFKENTQIHLTRDNKALISLQGETKHFYQKTWDIDLKENMFLLDNNDSLKIIHHSRYYLLFSNHNDAKILLKKK